MDNNKNEISELEKNTLNSLPVAIAIYNISDGSIIFINEKFINLFGYRFEDIKTLDNWCNQAYPEEKYRQVVKDIWNSDIHEANIDKKEIPARQYLITCKDKTEKHVEISFKIDNEKVIVSFIDISHQISNFKLVESNEERFRMLIDNHPAVIWSTNQQGKTVFISSNIEEVYGYKPDEIYSKGEELWIKRIHPDDVDLVMESFARLFSENKEFNVEYRIKRKDGKWIWLDDRAKITENIKGEKYAFGIFIEITERKKTELQLLKNNKELIIAKERAEENENRLKEAQHIAQLGHWELDIVNNKLFWSDEIYRIFALKPQEFKATYEAFLENIHPEDRDMVNEAYTNSLKTKTAYEIEHRLLLKTGELKYILEQCNTEYDKQGNPIRSIGTVLDITKSKTAEKKLKQATNIINASPAVAFLWKNEEGWPVEYVSENVKPLFGYSADEFMSGKVVYANIIHPDDLNTVGEEDNSFSKNMEVSKFTHKAYRIITKSGEIKWISDNTVIIRNSQKETTHYQGIILDITERKKAELELKKQNEYAILNEKLRAPEEEIRAANEELIATTDELIISNNELIKAKEKTEESEKKFREYFEKSGDAIFIMKNGIFIDCNQASLDLLGYKSKQEILKKSPANISPEFQADGKSSVEKAKEMIETALKNGTHRFEWLHKKSSGIIFPDEILLTTILNEPDNQIIYVVLRDISDRKKAEQELIANERRYRAIVENISDGLVILDKEGEFLSVNSAYCKIHGYSLNEILNLKVTDLIHEDNAKNIKNYLEFILKNGFWDEDVIACHKNGSKVFIHIKASVFNYNQDQSILVIVSDISERKKMEQRIYNTMIKAEERERERYARELHDGLGPLLSTCKIYFHTINSASNDADRTEHIKRTGELLDEALTTIKEISNNLSPDILRRFGLSQAIKSFTNKLINITKTDYIIHSNLKESLPETIEFTIYRTLVELINNSVKHADASEIKINIEGNSKELKIFFSDNGKGFDYEIVKKENKGFGLSNLENRIIKIGGTYHYSSSDGKGVQAVITLKFK